MKWDIDKADSVVWIAIEAAKSLCGSMKDMCGICFNEHLVSVREGHKFWWCCLESENEKVGNSLVERFKNRAFRQKFDRDYRNFYKKAVKELDASDRNDFRKISGKKLFSIFKKSNHLYIHNFDWGFFAEPMDFVMPKMVEGRLLKQSYTAQEIADMIAIADTSFINKETQGLICIGLKPKGKQQGLLKKHAYRYRWLQSAHMGRKDLPLSYFRERLDELGKKGLNKELKKLKDFKNGINSRKKEIVGEKPIDNETKALFGIMDVIGPLHDIRKELFMRTIYTADTCRAEIAKRNGYTKEQLSVFSAEDIHKLEQGKGMDKDHADNLLEVCVLYINNRKKVWEIHSGKEAEDIIRMELSVDTGGITEFKGMAASLGKARGRVKIINGTREMGKMEQGDVIVSSMTKPEFVVAIKKAVAIVTDEGGVTCHAAIVSRELKIPCIIGTKIATHLLKDGDIIEVDADKGVVRKIK